MHTPAFKVSWLRFEKGQAVGCLFCSIRELEGHLFCATQNVGQLQTQNLKQQQTVESLQVRWLPGGGIVMLGRSENVQLTILPSLFPTIVL